MLRHIAASWRIRELSSNRSWHFLATKYISKPVSIKLTMMRCRVHTATGCTSTETSVRGCETASSYANSRTTTSTRRSSAKNCAVFKPTSSRGHHTTASGVKITLGDTLRKLFHESRAAIVLNVLIRC